MAEVFPKKQEIQCSHQTPQARGSCFRKISPQNILKSSSTCFWESQRALGKRFPPFKKKLFVSLAVLGLSCSTQDFPCIIWYFYCST